MRVLFLDIDGVLNSHRTVVALNGYPHDVTPAGLAQFDMVAVALLRGLCKVGDIKVVLSSTWRLDPNWKDIGPALGLPIISCTPSLVGPRGKEIEAWLNHHPEVDGYVILDDDADMLPEQMPRFVKTLHEDGMTWLPFVKLCELFAVNPYDCNEARVRPSSPVALAWE